MNLSTSYYLLHIYVLFENFSIYIYILNIHTHTHICVGGEGNRNACDTERKAMLSD